MQRVMRGPLRDIIRQHHLNSSEHAKRLSSVEANAKFSSLEADADVPWTVREFLVGPALLSERTIKPVPLDEGMT
jgi:hypothetical protein